MRFIRKHPFLGSLAATPFLPPQFFDTRPLGIGFSFLGRFDLIQQQSPGNESVEPLLPCRLAFNLQPRRTVQQHHASGRLVHVLPAVSARPHKCFVQVGLENPQRSHAPRQLILFFWAYGKCAHRPLVKSSPSFIRASRIFPRSLAQRDLTAQVAAVAVVNLEVLAVARYDSLPLRCCR